MPLAKSTSRWRMTRVTRSIETHKASKPSKERRPSVSGPAWCHSGHVGYLGRWLGCRFSPARLDGWRIAVVAGFSLAFADLFVHHDPLLFSSLASTEPFLFRCPRACLGVCVCRVRCHAQEMDTLLLHGIGRCDDHRCHAGCQNGDLHGARFFRVSGDVRAFVYAVPSIAGEAVT